MVERLRHAIHVEERKSPMTLGMEPLDGPGGDKQEAQGRVGDRRSSRRESSYFPFFFFVTSSDAVM